MREAATVASNLDQECLGMLNRKHLVRCAIILCGALVICSSPVFAQQRVGFVLEMRGKWTDGDAHEFLKLGQLLPGQAVLSDAAPIDDDRIVVANLRGEIIETVRCKDGVCRECTESGACYDPIHPLPKAGDSAGTVSTLLNAVLDLFLEKPERYSVHRVRGGDPEVIKTQVVRLDANTVELGSLFQGKKKGRYEVQLVPISEKAKSGEKRQSFEGGINWNPGEKAALVLHDPAPGLYEVRLFRGSSTTTAWILLCAGADYQRSEDSFERFVHQTESWGGNVTPETKQAYQRVFLEYLDLHK
jgi:hypothetical protein